jgi:hypothetical protein
MDTVPITCPPCFEVFDVAAPAPSECPCQVDYDCEVCCRPLTIRFWSEGGEVQGEGSGLGD